jgi:hypothetical protein
LQRNQEGKFLPDVDRLTKSSGITDASTKGAKEFTAAWAELGQNLDTVKNQIYRSDTNHSRSEWFLLSGHLGTQNPLHFQRAEAGH